MAQLIGFKFPPADICGKCNKPILDTRFFCLRKCDKNIGKLERELVDFIEGEYKGEEERGRAIVIMEELLKWLKNDQSNK